MTYRGAWFIAAAMVAAAACGRTTADGEPGGAAGTAGASATSGSSDGSADTGGGSGSSTGGDSGAPTGGTVGDSSGGVGGGVTAGSDAGLPCVVLTPDPIPNPTPEEQSRAGLIHDFCVTLVRDNCLDWVGGSSFISGQTTGCSDEERIVGCEQDRLYEYYQAIAPECDAVWRAAITCGAAYQYSSEECASASLGENSAGPEACDAEGQALNECTGAHDFWERVTGSRTSCDFGPGTTGECEIVCQDGQNYFGANCGGPAGLPLRCVCMVNGHALGDIDFTSTEPFYASSCQEAAQQMADGECVDRLDCCFEYTISNGPGCTCGSDPGLLQFPSCEAAAEAYGGQVVDMCPQYASDSGICWPPPC